MGLTLSAGEGTLNYHAAFHTDNAPRVTGRRAKANLFHTEPIGLPAGAGGGPRRPGRACEGTRFVDREQSLEAGGGPGGLNGALGAEAGASRAENPA